MALAEIEQPQLHVTFGGVSSDFLLTDLDIGEANSDEQIKAATAIALNIAEGELRNYRVDKNRETGDISVRPQAVFGSSV